MLKSCSLLKLIVFSLFFLPGFLIFSQSIPVPAERARASAASGVTSFFVLPVRGEGSREEKAWFYDRIVYELVLQRFPAESKRSASDYTLRGTLDGEEGFLIELIRNRTNEILDERHLFFTIPDESTEMEIAWFIYDMLNNIPESGRKDRRSQDEDEEPEREIKEPVVRVRSEDWRDKVFFFEYTVLWAPRENIVDDKINYLNLGLNFAFEMQYLNFFAWDTGIQIVQETTSGEENRDLMLEYFFTLKIVLKPFKNIMIEPYAGGSYNFMAISKLEYPKAENPARYSELGYFGGLEFNIKTKNGIFVIDPRIAFDFATSYLGDDIDGNPINHRRRMLQLGIGYKTGFVTKMVIKRD